MLYLGCHLSVAKGFYAMGKEALSIGANTLAFFTRNPRGGKAKAIEEEDVKSFRKLLDENRFGKLVAHAPYTLNPCSITKNVREFAHIAMKEDLARMEMLPGNYYNFHPGSHTGQGVEVGISLISDQLNLLIRQEQTTIVLLETMAGKGSEIGSTFEELAQIIDRVKCKDKIGVCMDSCHVSDGNYDIVGDLPGMLKEFDRIVGLSYLKAMHLNDSVNPRGARQDRHAAIGQGCLGAETFRNIVNNPYLKTLPLILETPQDLEGYKGEIALLRSMEESS